MTSKLKTDILETVSGSGTIALTNQLSGMTSASVPSGSVLQVVSSLFKTNTTTTSTSYISTGHSVTITPKESTSTILLSLLGGHAAQATNRAVELTFYKGSSVLNTYFFSKHKVNADNLVHGHAMCGKDIHGVTSAITYTVYFKADGAHNVQYSSTAGEIFLTATEIKA
jgi:hypothetical protein